ncbi:MAG: hypothetical protein ACU837_02295 [Gammaproteobacteria bacterium]
MPYLHHLGHPLRPAEMHLQQLHGGTQFNAQGLLVLSTAEMRKAGLSLSKAKPIHGIAAAVV